MVVTNTTTTCYKKSLDTGIQMMQYGQKADILRLELELKGDKLTPKYGNSK